jgi:branched-chain amino acid aminotransferase
MPKPNSPVFYLNGKYIPEKEASISVLDIGLLRGYGIFDFLVTYSGRPFLIDEHINRLFNSASLIGLNIGKTKKDIKNIILQALRKNTDGKEKTVRIVITGGVGINSLEPASKPTIIVIVHPKYDYPNKYYSGGVKIITYNYTRPLASIKSIEYSIAIKALKEARKKNATEALYVNNKNKIISEATTSNLFIVKDNKIITPKDNILYGITRNLVINLYKKSSPIIEKNIPLNELLLADEVFITASNKEIMPVVKINSKKISKGIVGPVTKEVMKLFKDYIESGKW